MHNFKKESWPDKSQKGFTLLELMVVVVLIAICALMATRVFAHTHPNGRAIQCMNNLRQMQGGWQMYASDFTDFMLPNAPAGFNGWCPSGSENWFSSNYNTNPAPYLNSALAPYV